ncbi:hypothetical protein [Pseudomonas sp.]|jgi:hypothetical protein|uniref:hypothetical protein n=1 Tax=Pseudomonas sp. TaxID=306 RepID=UPI00272A25D7|nr:hypothetical protein [Pseudomonas sp.]
MRSLFMPILVALLASLAFSSAALAEDYYVDITNKTGYTIMHVYISPESSTEWEEDVLGKEVLRNHKAKRVNLKGYSSPIFDIRLVDEDGDTYTFWKVDVSRDDLVVTLDDVD